MRLKKALNILLIFFIFLLFVHIIHAQNKKNIDSLKHLLKTTNQDTLKIKLRDEIGGVSMILRIGYFDSIRIDCEKFINSSSNEKENKVIKKYLALSLNRIGFIYYKQGNIPKSIEYLQRSINISEEIGDKEFIANALNNIGSMYFKLGVIPKSLEYHHKCLKISEGIKDNKGIFISLCNIAGIYNKQGDIPMSLEYYERSLKISEEIKDKEGIANTLKNIGSIYNKQGDISKAIEYYNKCLIVYEEIGDKGGIAVYYNKMGEIFFNQAKEAKTLQDFSKADSLIKKALENYNKSLNIYERIRDKEYIVRNLVNIGEVYYYENNIAKALNYAIRAHTFAIEFGIPNNIEISAGLLKEINIKKGNYKEAFEYYELEIKMHDSITKDENIVNTQKQQAKYEYGKKAAVDSLANSKAIEIKNLVIGKQKITIYIFIGGFVIILILLLIILRLFVHKRKANLMLINQNEEITTKNKEIIKQKEAISSHLNEIENQRDKLNQQNQLLAEQKQQLEDRQIIIDNENAQLKIKNMETENQQLKQQIHPHFLFNSLNTLRTLIKNDTKVAEDYLINLSNFLRVSISSDNINLVTINKELKFCIDYLEMQQIRYGEALQYNISISEEIMNSGHIPIFSLQQLIENSIKHNTFSVKKPLEIKIIQQGDRIIVNNNIQKKYTEETSTGIGLKNISERYKILSGDEVIISNDDNVFSVSLKIL